MGGMMDASGVVSAWVVLWIVLALAVGAAGGFLTARSLHPRRNAAPPHIPTAESPAVREAKDALRLRYANGEISREAYLQGKVELED